MSRKSKLSFEEKIAAVEDYKRGKGSYDTISKKYKISSNGLKQMVAIYESQGKEGLQIKLKNKVYSNELKEQAVTDYLSGKGSQLTICKKYKISSTSLLRDWIKVYNGHKYFRNHTGSRTEIFMTKGRKTTQKERVDIVAFCIAHGRNYALTVQTYTVSYQQIYAWVRKYESKGIEGLSDRRGKAKPESEMSEADKLNAEIKMLKAKNYELEMENALIKKLKELERGGR